MYDFYKMGYDAKYLTLEELKDATKWNVLSKEDFKKITGQEYIEE
ncbi:XkdX family protein [Hathewaya limosa]|uniref:XkdX family protein n=1 Tax=Hathewaya limosa TaxID=1536 RepID=A0ABU0JU08_HATLI|nr:XkdX family protein [Hathewaya limosa]AWZ48328.1 XkdX family protein [Clostridiaceae bacterium 14S0207]MDQ0479711.1 hypothetical protein [Hathewaya limosa]